MHPILAALLLVLASTTSAPAQSTSTSRGFDQGRDCQTIRTCNFTRGGSFRGCVSSYSCRVCRFVAANCTLGARGQVCRQSVCTWGG